MIELNLLKGTMNDSSPVVVNEREFWRHYLFLLNIRTNAWINQKEIEILSWILSQEPGVCYFSVPNSRITKESIPRLSDAELSRLRKRLLELGLVIEHEQPSDKRRKVTLPNEALFKFQKFIKRNNTLSLIFPYEITQEQKRDAENGK